MKNKKGFIAGVICLAVSVLLIALVIMPQVNKQSMQNEEKTVTSDSGEVVNKPTFMYFVTSSELADKNIKKVLDKLEEEYGSKVIFEIKNVDTDKKLLEDFPVKDNTPALIMLDSNNDITNIMFKTSEYDKLKVAIDGAF
ncbi:MAG: hypothetical protein J6C82_04665 [Clostridia bacterium]|nr:hypothetical protein [Clostridia bacterium]